MEERPEILDLDFEEVAGRLRGAGALERGPRLPEQVWRGLFQQGAESFGGVPGLSHRKVARLEEQFRLALPRVEQVERSWDGSARYALRLGDGEVVESVLLPKHGRYSLCLSSQAGCALGCRFCATGLLGLRRNLRVGEIVGQVVAVARHAGVRVRDLVFMGMGEPLQNEAAVLKTCRILQHRSGAQISARRMVISTAGLVPAIHRFAEAGHRMTLVFSLGSAVPEKRERLMPIQRVFGFESLLDAIRAYAASRGSGFVTLEYVAIRGLTLGDDDIDAIREHLRGFKFILNVIPFNQVGSELEAPTREEVKAWTARLRPLGFPVKVRWSGGSDVRGGCGQLGASLLQA